MVNIESLTEFGFDIIHIHIVRAQFIRLPYRLTVDGNYITKNGKIVYSNTEHVMCCVPHVSILQGYEGYGHVVSAFIFARYMSAATTLLT